MSKKISIGTWAYTFGPYQDNPVPFDTVVRRVAQLGLDGVEIGAFRPHVHPDDYPMDDDRRRVAGLLRAHGLEVSGVAADFWSTPGPGTKEALQNDAYFKLFKKNVQLCLDLGADAIRVDCVDPPDKYDGAERAAVWDRIVAMWKRCAEFSEGYGVKVVYEFEPGFIFNKPSEIARLAEEVGHPNFGVLFDTCHAYMCAVVGARQHGAKETLKGGVEEFIRLLRGKINHVHVIDSDGTLHGNETSTHRPFGEGKIDFGRVLPALEAEGGYFGKWWTIDLCFWPEAWEVTEKAVAFLRKHMR